MDFRKIEGIFLLAFLGLNIFLLSIFSQTRSVASEVSPSEERDAIELRLSKDKVSYKGDFSKETLQGYYLAAVETNLGSSRVNANNQTEGSKLFTDNILINVKTQDNDIDSFLNSKQYSPYPGEYTYIKTASKFSGDDAALIAAQTYEKISFYDPTAQMTMTISPVSGDVYQIDKMQYSHLDDIINLRESQDLISERDAVSTLYYNSKLSAGSKINWRLLAYGRILKVREKNVYVPCWFVSVTADDGSTTIEQVNAVSNTIITGNTITKVEN